MPGQGSESIRYPWGVAPPGVPGARGWGAGAEPARRGGPDPPLPWHLPRPRARCRPVRSAAAARPWAPG